MMGEIINPNEPENPFAFPLDPSHQYVNEGMTLRDYFAGKCMQGYLASLGPGCTEDNPGLLKIRADAFYAQADAMLTARQNKNS